MGELVTEADDLSGNRSQTLALPAETPHCDDGALFIGVLNKLAILALAIADRDRAAEVGPVLAPLGASTDLGIRPERP